MPGLEVIIGKGKPGAGADEDGGAGYDDRLEMQMTRLARALKTGDFKAAAEAFRAAHEECADGGAEPDGDETESGGSAMDE